jgi:hypothetical protein
VSVAYSTSFIVFPGLTSTLSFTVPPGFRAVIRDVAVFHGIQIPPVEVIFSGQFGTKFWHVLDNGSGPFSAHWEGRVVVEAGNDITAAVVAGNADVTVSGYLLSLP